eukprot:55796-Eustigmatos_ZCMA.PRE.1
MSAECLRISSCPCMPLVVLEVIVEDADEYVVRSNEDAARSPSRQPQRAQTGARGLQATQRLDS